MMEDYKDMIANLPVSIKADFENNQHVVEANMDFLKSIGVKEYNEVFKMYYPMFLMDNSNFANIFNKYDKNDLLDKINKNLTIIEHL
jgi:hypothetical protein